MFWKKKPTPPPLPQVQSSSSSIPTKPMNVGGSGNSTTEFSKTFTGEMKVELERIGEASDDDMSDADVLTTGIGMIKMGAKELLPGWLSQFGKALVYSVGIDSEAPESAFVFGPREDRNYLPIFTRRSLADECVSKMPPLKFVIPIQGLTILGRV